MIFTICAALVGVVAIVWVSDVIQTKATRKLLEQKPVHSNQDLKEAELEVEEYLNGI